MDRDKKYPDPRQFMEFDEDDPRYQVRILSLRLDTLTKEKEDIEDELRDEKSERKKLDVRVAAMEKTFQRGAGMMILIPVIGAIFGVLISYGNIIFSPWIKKIGP